MLCVINALSLHDHIRQQLQQFVKQLRFPLFTCHLHRGTMRTEDTGSKCVMHETCILLRSVHRCLSRVMLITRHYCSDPCWEEIEKFPPELVGPENVFPMVAWMPTTISFRVSILVNYGSVPSEPQGFCDRAAPLWRANPWLGIWTHLSHGVGVAHHDMPGRLFEFVTLLDMRATKQVENKCYQVSDT